VGRFKYTDCWLPLGGCSLVVRIPRCGHQCSGLMGVIQQCACLYKGDKSMYNLSKENRVLQTQEMVKSR
jgi:hypothetical protein